MSEIYPPSNLPESAGAEAEFVPLEIASTYRSAYEMVESECGHVYRYRAALLRQLICEAMTSLERMLKALDANVPPTVGSADADMAERMQLRGR